MTAHLTHNPLRGATPPPTVPGPVTEFHRRFPDYEPSPLYDLPTLAASLGVARVLVKDESDRLGLPAFKMLGAAWASYRALVDRLGHEPKWSTFAELSAALEPLRPMALATATDGNHGRAVASFARRVGLEARIFVPAGTSRSRIDAVLGEGASCEVVDGTYEDAVARAALEADEHCLVISDTSWEGYETIPAIVIEGYATIFAEVADQSAAAALPEPDLVVIPMGVGALAAATAQWYRRDSFPSSMQLLGVEPVSANCVQASAEAGRIVEVPGPHRSIMAGLNCGLPSPVAWPWVSTGFDWFVSIDDADAEGAMRALADCGVVSGETGAASLGAMQAIGDLTGRGLGPDATV
ncbi:MAG: diaminopropionate ammonia-lyase, partial [Acidimicrobiia bacterium]